MSEVLYHGSPSFLKVLEPRNYHGDPKIPSAIFASPSKSFALAYAGAKWGDRDLEQSIFYKADNEDDYTVTLREMRPHAFEEVYKNKSGYLYTLSSRSFTQSLRGRTKWEQISYSPVVPSRINTISDVWEALQQDPRVRFYEYDVSTPQTKRAIERSIDRMAEMPPEEAAQYFQWRLERATPEIRDLLVLLSQEKDLDVPH